jgi:hypothetical protein
MNRISKFFIPRRIKHLLLLAPEAISLVSDSPKVSAEHPQGCRHTNVENIEKAQKGRVHATISWNAELFKNSSRERLLSPENTPTVTRIFCCLCFPAESAFENLFCRLR